MLRKTGLFLLLFWGNLAFTGDHPVDTGGVEESKHGSTDPEAVLIKIGEQKIAAPRTILEQFSLFEPLLETNDPRGPLEIPLDPSLPFLNSTNLKRLFSLLMTDNPITYPQAQVLEIFQLADYLELKNINLILRKLIDFNSFEWPLALKGLPGFSCKLDLIIMEKTELVRKNVIFIIWNPAYEQYWAMFKNGHAQLYNQDGRPVGDHLMNVDYIYWNPTGTQYWVVFLDGQAQLYNQDGTVVDARLNDVFGFYWDSTGTQHWVIFRNGYARLYNQNNAPLDKHLTNVYRIYHNPSNTQYWVVFQDGQAQLYNQNGTPVDTNLTNVFNIYWNPTGTQYWVVFRDHIAQLYNQDHMPIGAQLDNVCHICSNPTNTQYWVVFQDGRAKFYNQDGVHLGAHLNNVDNIYPNHTGTKYWVVFNNWFEFYDHAKLYQSRSLNNLPCYQQVLVQAIMNEYSQKQAPILVPKIYLELLDAPTIKLLEDAGLIRSRYWSYGLAGLASVAKAFERRGPR